MARKNQGKRPAPKTTPAGNGATYIPARAGGRTTVTPKNGAGTETAPPPAAAPPEVAAPPGRRRGLRGWRLALAIVGSLLVVLVLAVAAYVAYLVNNPLAQTNGTLKLAGLSAPVTVTRDKQGIPHITAATQADLFRAQGYVAAQDRLWQMDFYRRVGAGRLSEVLGGITLDTDSFVRTVGWRRAAQKELAALPADSTAALQQYADGVNAFLDSHADSLPIEFTVLGYKPEHWAPLDTVTFGKVMAWDLSGNWDLELTMADLQAKLGPERAAQLLPSYPGGATTIVPQSALPGKPEGRAPGPGRSGVFGTGVGGELVGSNNWVLAGSHTADGHPLLANDPHLGVQNPSIWYAMQLRAQDGSFDAEGVTFAGVPGIVVGHNRNIVWGVTNLGPDTQDLYIEKLDPAAHPGQYLYKGAWQPLQMLTETIPIKGDSPVTLTITSTVHGPLLNTVDTQIGQPAAFHWTALEPGGLLPSVLHLDHATNWAEFHAALSTWDVPGQNFVYADTQGNIGYQATGRWPIRPKGNGLAPVDGSSGAYDWAGYVPYEKLPSVYNPPQGYLVTANNRVTDPASPYQATGWWGPWFRAQRITQMITAQPKLSLEDMKAIQHDTHSVAAVHIGKALGALQGGDARTQQAVALFKNWDGNISADSPAAAVYEITYRQILTNTFADELGSTLALEYTSSLGGAAAILLDKMVDDPANVWWDDVTTPGQKETRDDILRKSLSAAAGILTDQQGDDMTKWSWAQIHRIGFDHKLGVVPLNLLLNFGPYPTGGDSYTVNVGTAEELPGAPNTFAQTSHPSMRMITDPQDWTRTQLVFAPGESGQPGSPHWGDQVAAWLGTGYFPLAWTDAQVQQGAEATLTLQP